MPKVTINLPPTLEVDIPDSSIEAEAKKLGMVFPPDPKPDPVKPPGGLGFKTIMHPAILPKGFADTSKLGQLPADVLTVSTGESWNFYTPGLKVDFQTLFNQLSKLPKTKKYLFGIYSQHNPPALSAASYWNNWVNNVATVARAVKAAGFVGLLFDFELYYALSQAAKTSSGERDWSMDFMRLKREGVSEAEAIRRYAWLGQKCGEAIHKNFSDALVLTLHGLENSVPEGTAKPDGIAADRWALAQGYFGYGAWIEGLLKAASGVTYLSGGEIFYLRSQSDFNSYLTWLKKESMALNKGISADYKDDVIGRTKFGAMIGDFAYKNWQTGAMSSMDAQIYGQTVKNLLASNLDFAIFYMQEHRDGISQALDPKGFLAAIERALS